MRKNPLTDSSLEYQTPESSININWSELQKKLTVLKQAFSSYGILDCPAAVSILILGVLQGPKTRLDCVTFRRRTFNGVRPPVFLTGLIGAPWSPHAHAPFSTHLHFRLFELILEENVWAILGSLHFISSV